MTRANETGSSLIEALIALAVLAAALISIADLMILGTAKIRSGGRGSKAVCIARSILEELDGWGFRQLYLEFGHDGTASSYVVDCRSAPPAAKWQRAAERDLAGAHAEIVLESSGSDAAPLSAARSIHVTVTVSWREGPRHRAVSLRTVRM